jgi:hypothetical protein
MATPAKIFFDNMCHHIPEFILTRLSSNLPGQAMRQVRENRTIVHKVAKSLIKDKSTALLEGKGQRDVMSLLGEHPFYLDFHAFCLTEISESECVRRSENQTVGL